MHMQRRTRAWSFVASALMIGLFAGCVSRVEPASPSGSGGGAPPSDPMMSGALVVEQFLRAVNANDLDSMARLFGTREGPIVRLYDKKQVDDRMFALANILKHDDYQIVRSEIVPGRREEATNLIVRMNVRGRQSDVPYTLVWSNDRTWLIEQIDLQKVTGR
jgi:hypothetical protein